MLNKMEKKKISYTDALRRNLKASETEKTSKEKKQVIYKKGESE